MHRFFPSAFVFLVTLSAFAYAQPRGWKVQTESSRAKFKIGLFVMSSVTGEFGGMQGTLTRDDADSAKTRIEATIDAKTLGTENEKRDAHLKSADFFDVEKYPLITFKSTKVEMTSADGECIITGELTMHGITKEVTLDGRFTDEPRQLASGSALRLTATGHIRRKDFGLMYEMAGFGPVMISLTADLTIDIAFTRSTPEKQER